MKLFYKAALAAAFTVTSVVGLAVTPASAAGNSASGLYCDQESEYGVCFYELDNFGGTPEYPSEFGLGKCHATTQVNHSVRIWLTDKVDGAGTENANFLAFQNADCTGYSTGLGGLGGASTPWGVRSYCITREYPYLTCTP
jgi:hypothetical protein